MSSLTPERDALFATLEKQGHIKIFGVVGIPGPSGLYGIYGWQTGDGRRAIITETYEGDCVIYKPEAARKETQKDEESNYRQMFTNTNVGDD